MYVIDTYVRDARGDTVHIVGPYEVRTGLEINKKNYTNAVFIVNILDWFVFHHMLGCYYSKTVSVTVLWDVMRYSLVDKLTFWRNLLCEPSG